MQPRRMDLGARDPGESSQPILPVSLYDRIQYSKRPRSRLNARSRRFRALPEKADARVLHSKMREVQNVSRPRRDERISRRTGGVHDTSRLNTLNDHRDVIGPADANLPPVQIRGRGQRRVKISAGAGGLPR